MRDFFARAVGNWRKLVSGALLMGAVAVAAPWALGQAPWALGQAPWARGQAPVAIRAAEEAALPRIERVKIVYGYEPGVRLVPAADGTMLIDSEPEVWHDDCVARYQARPFAMPHRRLRQHGNTNVQFQNHVPLQGVDALGRAWFVYAPHRAKEGLLWMIADGQLTRQSIGEDYAQCDMPRCPARWPWVGHELLIDDQGGGWVVGRDKLLRLDKNGKVSGETAFPKPGHEQDEKDLHGTSPYWSHQVYRLGDSIWVVRSFYSNCRTPGSFVLRFRDGDAALMLRTTRQYVTGLVAQRGGVCALVEDRIDDTRPEQYKPVEVLHIQLRQPKAQPDRTVAALIADLTSDSFHTRERATAALGQLPIAQLPLLETAAKNPADADQKDRLQQAMRAVRALGPESVQRAKLGGADAARLALVDGKGRAYLQLWDGDSPTRQWQIGQGDQWQRLEAPSPQFTIDCENRDGLIYGHDERRLYSLEPQGKELTPLASLGDLTGSEVRVLTEQQGLLCVSIPMSVDGRVKPAPLWLDLRQPAQDPPLVGAALVDRLMPHDNASRHHPVAVGDKDLLWFVRYSRQPVRDAAPGAARYKVSTQLARIRGFDVTWLNEPTPTSFDPTVWPLGPHAAIVMTMSGNDGVAGVLLHDEERTTVYPALQELLEAEYLRLMQVMSDGAAFVAGAHHERAWLIRMGDGFYLEEQVYERFRNGAGSYERSGLYRAGQWVKQDRERPQGRDTYQPVINRVMGLDVRTHRVLGYCDRWKTLKWVALASDSAPEETVASGATPWAWCWFDQSPLPRFTGAWGLAPAALDHFYKAQQQRRAEAEARGSEMPDFDARYHKQDFQTMRRWRQGRWRELNQSMYGGAVWEDAAGGVWHMRTREAQIILGDGSEQLLPLDAGSLDQYRLVIESKIAVWVASQTALVRYELAPDEQDGKHMWQARQRFALPRLGVHFAGPWVARNNLYWMSGDTLYAAPLATLRQ
ncbi:MAG: hypothetical protein WD042_04350 [Phycisphaeraceae bacterium]